MSFRNNAAMQVLRHRSLALAVGVVALPLSLQFHELRQMAKVKPRQAQTKPAALRRASTDPRVARLERFFQGLHCPVAHLSADFVRVADKNHLDWRLLPGIAIIESGGGKAYRNNNIFGWGGGELAFSSVLAGLETVAYKLGHSSLYRRHDSAGKLKVYNQADEYAASVLEVMDRISEPGQRPRVRAALELPSDGRNRQSVLN